MRYIITQLPFLANIPLHFIHRIASVIDGTVAVPPS